VSGACKRGAYSLSSRMSHQTSSTTALLLCCPRSGVLSAKATRKCRPPKLHSSLRLCTRGVEGRSSFWGAHQRNNSLRSLSDYFDYISNCFNYTSDYYDYIFDCFDYISDCFNYTSDYYDYIFDYFDYIFDCFNYISNYYNYFLVAASTAL
jgi:hypothetical protein